MGMATNSVGDQARAQHQQLVNTIRQTINFNDPGIAAGAIRAQLPMGAFITRVLVEIVIAFNAVTTNVLTAGLNANMDNVIAAGDLNETALGVTDITRALGRSLTAAGVTNLGFKYTQTGTAATTGQAEIVVEYEANTG